MFRKSTRRFRYSKGFQRFSELATYAPQERMLDMAFAFARWAKLEGDYLEFGVYDGWSMTAAYHLSCKHGFTDMRFRGFDSFSGLPESTGVDQFPFRQFVAGQLSCDRRTVERHLRRDGVDMSRVDLTEGWYSDTLTLSTREGLGIDKAAIVWIDCDLYDSTVPVLDFIEPVLEDGTVLIFDDWYLFRGHPERGQRRAFTEWLQRNPDLAVTPFAKPGWHEASFIVHPHGNLPAAGALVGTDGSPRQAL